MNARQKLQLVRGAHTIIYLVMAASILLVLYAGISGAKGVWLRPALVLAATECVVFVGAGLRCPLTALVARYDHGARPVSDTFFPERCMRYTLAVFGPLLLIGLALLVARWRRMIG